MENKQIKVKIIKQVPVIRTLNIVNLDTWNLNKNNFIIKFVGDMTHIFCIKSINGRYNPFLYSINIIIDIFS